MGNQNLQIEHEKLELVALDETIEIAPMAMFRDRSFRPVLDKIVEHVRSFVGDTSTKKGRDEIKSRAYKVARTISAVDDIGKRVTEKQRADLKEMDAERKFIKDTLRNLQEEVKAPLTKWEAEETARIEAIQAKIAEISELGKTHGESGEMFSSEALYDRLAKLEVLSIDETYGELKTVAEATRLQMIQTVSVAADLKKKDEEREVEFARLKAEEEARKKAAEEERIRREAEDRIRKENEERDRQLLKEQAEREATLERERLQALEEVRLAKEESERKDREAKAAADKAKIEAEERAREAAQKARDEAEAEAKAKVAEEERRAADKENRRKVHLIIQTELFNLFGIPKPLSDEIVEAIAKKKIPHVRIDY